MIEVKNLTKKYGSFTALKNVSFSIEKGRIYGLLGPNGAGKSTTMNIMTGCLAATEGTVSVNGFDIYENAKDAKKAIGYLPEIPPLYTDMTPNEFLRFVARSKGVGKKQVDEEIERVSKLCGLNDVSERLIKNLSKGYRQRVGIAEALIGDPEVIILDEPTVGLDPIQLIEIRNLIRSLKKDHAVILSSHIMGEITAVCDYIIIMAYGRVVAEGTPDELEGENSGNVTIEAKTSVEMAKKIRKEILSADKVVSCEYLSKGEAVKFTVKCEENSDVREELFGIFVSNNAPIIEMTKEQVSLESLFVRLTSAPAPSDEDEEKQDKKPQTKKYSLGLSPLGGAYLDGEEKQDDSEKEKNGSGDYKPLFGDGKGENK